jgi:hypothetical protein
MLKDFKFKMLNSTGSCISEQEFLTKFYKMLEDFNIPGNYFEASTLWMMGKPLRIFEFDGSYFAVQVASGTYRMFALPVSLTYEKLLSDIRMCLDLGISLSYDERAFPELSSEYTPSTLNDNHNYYPEHLATYWESEASPQAKKIKRRLEREYGTSLIKAEKLTADIVSRILEINHIWLTQFKENSKGSSDTLSYIDNILKKPDRFSNNYFILYRSVEDLTIMAYDYIEVYGKHGIVSAGKSLIPKVSSFRYVTTTIVEYLKSVGAEYCSIGGTRFYDLDHNPVVSGGSYNLDSLYEAKMSLPNELTFTKVYKFNIKKFKEVDVTPQSSSLF